MNVKQRILEIRLGEKLKRHPEYAKAIGLSFTDHFRNQISNSDARLEGKRYKNTLE